MHARKLAGAVVGLWAATAWAQAGAAKVDPALEATHTKFAEAFNTMDPQAVASFFAEDATLINPLGKVAQGRAEIAKVFAEDAGRIFKGATSTFTITGARKIGADTVWLDVEHVAKNAKMPDGKTGTITHHVVMLAQKQGEDWKWVEARPYAFIPGDHAHAGAAGKAKGKPPAK
jgi:uncharacterized protein (TIGR02246 family)